MNNPLRSAFGKPGDETPEQLPKEYQQALFAVWMQVQTNRDALDMRIRFWSTLALRLSLIASIWVFVFMPNIWYPLVLFMVLAFIMPSPKSQLTFDGNPAQKKQASK